MKAILSDIHGNLEALTAVLDDAARRGVEHIYCLGDLVGYGPNPRECVELAMKWNVVLQGQFDYEVLNDPPSLGPTAIIATKSLMWSRSQLTDPVPNEAASQERWAFLTNLPTIYSEDGILFVHGSPRNPRNEYVYPDDPYIKPKMKLIFEPVKTYCFHGHTHVPGVMLEDCRFITPRETNDVFRLGDCKALINVGSVGQPRDGDRRACYAILDNGTVQFLHVEYDVETTIKKIRDIDDLDDFSGGRLGDGR